MISDRCLSCLSVCLFVTLVYFDETVERIKMKLGTKVGVGPGDFVLDGDPPPPKKKGGTAPNFRPISIVTKRVDGSRCHFVG